MVTSTSWSDDRIIDTKRPDNYETSEGPLFIPVSEEVYDKLWKPSIIIHNLKSMDVQEGLLKDNQFEIRISTGK